MKAPLILALGMAATAPGEATVKTADPNGFELVAVAQIGATPEQVYTALIHPAGWWIKDHSYSGSSANLRLEPRAGGCFCETLPAAKGSVEHARVVMAWPGKMLRLRGSLGPLQQMGVTGSLTWTLKAVNGRTEITQTYAVGGYVPGGADRIAPMVDTVMSAQLAALKASFAAR